MPSVVAGLFQPDWPAVERIVQKLVELRDGLRDGLGDAKAVCACRIGAKWMAAWGQHQLRTTPTAYV